MPLWPLTLRPGLKAVESLSEVVSSGRGCFLCHPVRKSFLLWWVKFIFKAKSSLTVSSDWSHLSRVTSIGHSSWGLCPDNLDYNQNICQNNAIWAMHVFSISLCPHLHRSAPSFVGADPPRHSLSLALLVTCHHNYNSPLWCHCVGPSAISLTNRELPGQKAAVFISGPQDPAQDLHIKGAHCQLHGNRDCVPKACRA